MSFVVKIFRRALAAAILSFGRHILKWNRLEKIDLLDLGASMEDAISLYGDPIESQPDEPFPGATTHTFSAVPFHEVVVVQWNKRISLVTYWSAYPDSHRDLKTMLARYGAGIGWDEHEPGYLCLRKDKKVWLRCSAAPALCVETADFLGAKRAASKTKNDH